jgi:hypothetical protein
LTFDPANGQFGNTGFTYTVNDGNGGTDVGSVNIVVNEQDVQPINNAPNAFDVTLVVDDDAAATALNIPAPVDADGDTLTVTINGLPGLGVLMLNGVAVQAGQVLTVAQLQALTFDPANNNFGSTSFTYTVNDGNGGTDTATVSITVNEQDVQPVNNAPVAVDQSLVVDNDAAATALNIPAPTDADGDTLSVIINGLPDFGVLLLNGVAVHDGQLLNVAELQSLTFDPANGQFGSTGFTYTVNDGNGGTDTATVNIVVNPAINAVDPVAELMVPEYGMVISEHLLNVDERHEVTPVGPLHELTVAIGAERLDVVQIDAWQFDEAHEEIVLSDKNLGIEGMPVDNGAYTGGEFIAQNDQVPVVGLWDTLPIEPVQQYHVM